MNRRFPSFITRPPPCSTLFPYTTLFRSDSSSRADSKEKKDKPGRRGHGRKALPESLERRRVVFDLEESQRQCGQDRKSTRLNSSHRCISYAVFCLKKKKNKNRLIHNRIN